jgi:hypothetical protein
MSDLIHLPKVLAVHCLMVVAICHTVAAAWLFSGPLLENR